MHIRMSGVTRTFPGPVPTVALREASFEVAPGEGVAIVGRSGSGKSTLLALLGLMDRPTAGVYLIDGEPTGELSDKARTALRGHRFGFVFQAFHLLEDRSVLDNTSLGAIYTGLRRAERMRRATAVLEEVGLGHRLHARAATLSGGERQRVAIARALMAGPEVLLCDEPTGNLDSSSASVVLNVLRDLNSHGVSLVIVTHDEAVAQNPPRCLRVTDGVVGEDER